MTRMPRSIVGTPAVIAVKVAAPAVAAVTVAALTVASLAGCGGTTKTVSVSGSAGTPAASATSTATTQTDATARTTTSPPPAGTQQTSTAPAGGTPAPSTQASTTRTAPEPAFAQHGTGGSAGEAAGAEVAAAVAVVKGQGYTPSDTAEYHPHQTLQVLLGTRTGSADSYDQRAFFFLDGKYIGTDSSQPSASMRVIGQSDTEVVIAYALYRPHDPPCCPGGGQATVHFQLNDGQLTPLQPIPPASSATGLSRQ